MNKAKDPWYWHNLNVATALILLVAMLALCCWLAPDRPKKATVYQNDNLMWPLLSFPNLLAY